MNLTPELIAQVLDYQRRRIDYFKATNKMRDEETIIYNILREEEKKVRKESECNIPFLDFWAAYRKNTNSKRAKALWVKLTNEERESVMVHVPKYVASTPDKQYRKNPDVYLRNESWNDEIITKCAVVVPEVKKKETTWLS